MLPVRHRHVHSVPVERRVKFSLGSTFHVASAGREEDIRPLNALYAVTPDGRHPADLNMICTSSSDSNRLRQEERTMKIKIDNQEARIIMSKTVAPKGQK